MTPETKAILIQSYRDMADALEADNPQAYPDFGNDVAVIVDNPETVWTDDQLTLQWSLSVYNESYKDLRELTKGIAQARDLSFTTSFIPDDTIETTFIIVPLNQGGKK
ncbi:hypothetical protein KAR91_41970 [Candidatus Pacearchaeota archaeon]|nr:hypothetical protein [Candidatus Pacearchaeota archaeon]